MSTQKVRKVSMKLLVLQKAYGTIRLSTYPSNVFNAGFSLKRVLNPIFFLKQSIQDVMRGTQDVRNLFQNVLPFN